MEPAGRIRFQRIGTNDFDIRVQLEILYLRQLFRIDSVFENAHYFRNKKSSTPTEKLFSSGKYTAQIDIGEFKRTQLTELNLVKNSKTSCRFSLPPKIDCRKEHTYGRQLLKNIFENGIDAKQLSQVQNFKLNTNIETVPIR
jgi:type II secretory ATPase GspE/PulE/Tfp pilus assembly ATPase PilB-like protein